MEGARRFRRTAVIAAALLVLYAVLAAGVWVAPLPTFVVANVAIAAAYTFIAFEVVPLIPVSRVSRWLFWCFLVTCGLGTHGEHVMHALAQRSETIGDMITAPHMVIVHVVQAFAAWGFGVSFFYDLRQIRADQAVLDAADAVTG